MASFYMARGRRRHGAWTLALATRYDRVMAGRRAGRDGAGGGLALAREAGARSGRARLRAVRRPHPTMIRAFQRGLLAWYARHGRDLPWRRTRVPYRILVSEIMLQQTQVDRVVPKYREFLRRYPTLRCLAAADVDQVRRLWYPLGYNVRPRRLHSIAREAVARYGGRLPDRAETLRSLPGVGRYTAGAILSFAYGRDVAVLDTNVRRVLSRVFVGPRRAARARGEKRFWDLAESLVPAGRGYDFNQALMDFGATWCTPRRPRCRRCPMTRLCASYSVLARGPVARA
jgi:A/G-specific adenine glycosylase